MSRPRPNRKGPVAAGSSALDDPGTTQILLFVGWIPPAVAASVSGIILAIRTGNLWALAVVAVGGTVVGYITSLTVLFTIGWYLQRRRVRGWAIRAFVFIDVAAGVVAAVAIGILASIAISLALQATGVAIGFVVVVVVVIALLEARSSP
jgi:hypothetical protein